MKRKRDEKENDKLKHWFTETEKKDDEHSWVRMQTGSVPRRKTTLVID